MTHYVFDHCVGRGSEDVPEAAEVKPGATTTTTPATTTSTMSVSGANKIMGHEGVLSNGMTEMWSDEKNPRNFSAFSDDVMKYVFTHEMPTMDVAELTVTGIQVFHLYFVTMNHKERNVKVHVERPASGGASRAKRFASKLSASSSVAQANLANRAAEAEGEIAKAVLWSGSECWPPLEWLERTGAKLLGMKDLTRIALEAKDPLVGQAAINLICTMHTKVSKQANQLVNRSTNQSTNRSTITHFALNCSQTAEN
jgi:hypothetical protein